MNYEKFIEILNKIQWFSNSGKFESNEKKISIPNLSAWDYADFSESLDERMRAIASEMDWLPTTRDQEDPIYGNQLKEALRLFPGGRELVMAACKMAMKSLHNIDSAGLKSGPNDFTEAAKGAALYCIRMSAIEVVLGKPGFWSELFHHYADGFWPCGILNNGVIVIY